jgi:hypothetical protein
LIGKAQTDTVSVRRDLHTVFGKRDVVNTLVERVAPAMSDRKSGFTTISIVGKRRGDNTLLVKLSLMTKPEVLHTFKSGQTFVKPTPAGKPTSAGKPTPAGKPVAKKVSKPATAGKPAATKVVAEKKAEPKKAAPAKKTAAAAKPVVKKAASKSTKKVAAKK